MLQTSFFQGKQIQIWQMTTEQRHSIAPSKIGQLDLVEAILTHGANLSLKSSEQKTPIQFASQLEMEEIKLRLSTLNAPR